MEQKVLFVFVDGVGLGPDDRTVNPLADREQFPTLGSLLAQSIPLDASMGLPGLPQSATGQAALLTGLNTSELMGRHIEGFPPPRLKEVVRKHNIFSKLISAGKKCTFANDYWLDDIAQIPPRRESVTTVATLAAFGEVRGKPELTANCAVYHDLTREALRERGYKGPLITPEEAAEHLMKIADDQEFTLFEFFQTDHAGHSGDLEKVFRVLAKLDRFFCALREFDGLLVVCSDHGNIEDPAVRRHTANPVPLVASNPALFSSLQRIEELTPKLLKIMGV